MLDEEEQEYFRRAGDMLETNAFGDPEERNLFLASVYREADGKELKIAQSQSCSRLMERLIQLSTSEQLKTLFQKFGYVWPFLVGPPLVAAVAAGLIFTIKPETNNAALVGYQILLGFALGSAIQNTVSLTNEDSGTTLILQHL